MSDEKMYDSKLQMAANELHRLKAKGYDAQPLTDAEKSVEIINLQDEILKQDSQIASLATRLAQAEQERDDAQRLAGVLQREEKRQKERAIAAEKSSRSRYGALDTSVDLLREYKDRIRTLESQLEAAQKERDELKKQMEIDQHTRAYQVLVDAVPKAGIASVTGHAARIVVAELAAVTRQLEAARGEAARLTNVLVRIYRRSSDDLAEQLIEQTLGIETLELLLREQLSAKEGEILKGATE